MAATRRRNRGLGRLALGSALALAALSGCAENIAPRSASIDSDATASIRPSGLSPRPAALSVTQMEGAPTPLQTQFMALFNADVAQHDVALTDSTSARYLARGYLSAFPVDGGAKLTYVWDIYDRTNHRAQRLNDEIALKGSAADPWSLVDGAALSALAAQSAGALAAYLSNTPEALAQTPIKASPLPVTASQAIPSPQVEPAAALPPQALSYAGTR
jgi:hypothetical protein